MKTPPLFARLFGNPVIALCICAWFLHALAGWFLGQPSLRETIVAVCFAAASLRSWRRMRVHHARLRQWNDTGQEEEAPGRIPADGGRARRRSALMFVAPALGLMLLLMAANGASADELPMLRLLSLGCVAWLVIATVRKFKKHGRGQVESVAKADTASPVAWVSGPAHFAPSRASATSNLPDYALGVMGLRRRDH
ncbi:MAG TPA: hypothetical protein VGG72_28725 [Bryobacteraceae bacterium]|jgi:hypothetical protein